MGATKCETCNDKNAVCGLEGTRRRRWCTPCGKPHGAVSLVGKLCEKCGLKQASYGMAAGRKKQWCAPCGQSVGAVMVRAQKMCERCNDKQANYGLESDRRKRFCGACAKAQGAVLLHNQKMCEECKERQASCGLPGDKTAKWCGACVNSKRGAAAQGVRVGAIMCEVCGQKQASYGELTAHGTKRKRWCAVHGKERGGHHIGGKRKPETGLKMAKQRTKGMEEALLLRQMEAATAHADGSSSTDEERLRTVELVVQARGNYEKARSEELALRQARLDDRPTERPHRRSRKVPTEQLPDGEQSAPTDAGAELQQQAASAMVEQQQPAAAAAAAAPPRPPMSSPTTVQQPQQEAARTVTLPPSSPPALPL
jgi:hypothetical protein